MGNGIAEGLSHTSAEERTGLYLVRTDHWYIERAGWLIAGVAVLSGTLLAWQKDTMWILVVTVTAFCSILAGTSGFCIIGNLLKRLGLKGLLDGGSDRWYRMQTDSWYLERRIYLIIGINLTVGSSLVIFHSPWWVWYTGFVGTASVTFALTGFCIMAHILWKHGKEPRLGRE